MRLVKIENIPKLVKKLGDGEYRIKIKNEKVIILSKTKRYENDEIKKILVEIKKDEP